jgi:ferric-dicitrate binding protein FerR (iron transport regulator)
VGVPLTLRINPDLALEVEVMAGSVDIVGMRGPLAFSVTAGSLRANDCAGPFTGTIRAGSAKLDVRPVTGSSHVRIESGSVDLRLQSGSDVRLRTHAELGEIKIKNGAGPSTRVVDREGAHELVIGAGAASLDLDVVMGSVKVMTP